MGDELKPHILAIGVVVFEKSKILNGSVESECKSINEDNEVETYHFHHPEERRVYKYTHPWLCRAWIPPFREIAIFFVLSKNSKSKEKILAEMINALYSKKNWK